MTFHVVSIIHALASQPPKARAWRRGSESNTPPDTGYRDGGFEDRGGHQPRVTLHITRACCGAGTVLSMLGNLSQITVGASGTSTSRPRQNSNHRYHHRQLNQCKAANPTNASRQQGRHYLALVSRSSSSRMHFRPNRSQSPGRNGHTTLDPLPHPLARVTSIESHICIAPPL